jgi:hypothetical protein
MTALGPVWRRYGPTALLGRLDLDAQLLEQEAERVGALVDHFVQ